MLAHIGRFEFDVRNFSAVRGSPLLYWWAAPRFAAYAAAPKLGDIAPARQGLATANSVRFLRRPWELPPASIGAFADPTQCRNSPWPAFIKGAEGRNWCEPLSDVIRWQWGGLELRVWIELYRQRSPGQYIKNESLYFKEGIAFTTLGNAFGARLHMYPSIPDVMGASVYPSDRAQTLASMNTTRTRRLLEDLASGLHFTVADVNRLAVEKVEKAHEIVETLEHEFRKHEATREPSVTFRQPGPSRWLAAQQWAQSAVDRIGGPLPDPNLDQSVPTREHWLSYAVGVALGRFGHGGTGILKEAPGDALPDGILFLSPRTDDLGLAQAACKDLRATWEREDGRPDAASLQEWLRERFFDFHRKLYGNRPIYFPLSSSKRSFVAFVSIHRWSASTLTTLLSNYLIPERKALEGSLADIRKARAVADKKSRLENDRVFAQQSKWFDELQDFIAKVTQCADKGTQQPDATTPGREVDVPFVMNLEDGVMVNAAALWTLLEPMWKDPKKWWKELATADGRKDYDWSHLAARYFPTRVDEKCQKDPSLAIAHGCFWKYHAEKAYQWELRMQNERSRDFCIDEKESDGLRKDFLANNAKKAEELREAEEIRRQRKTGHLNEELLENLENEDAEEEVEADVG